MAGGEQPFHQKFTNEQRPANYENAHYFIALRDIVSSEIMNQP